MFNKAKSKSVQVPSRVFVSLVGNKHNYISINKNKEISVVSISLQVFEVIYNSCVTAFELFV